MRRLRLQLLAVAAAAVSFQTLVPWLSPDAGRGLSDAVIALFTGLAAVNFVRRMPTVTGRARAATVIGATAAGLWAVANVALLFKDLADVSAVGPFANGLSVAAAMLLPVGMHLYAPGVPGPERLRGLLDVASVSGAVFALTWLYAIAPAPDGASQDMTASYATLLTAPQVVAAAVALVTMSRHLPGRSGQAPRVIGAAAIVLAGTVLLSLRNGWLGDAWWAGGAGAGYILGAGLVMVASFLEPGSATMPVATSRLVRAGGGWAALPYIPIMLAVVATAREQVLTGSLSPVLVWVLLVTFSLVLFRQTITVAIVGRLAQTLDEQRAALAHQAHHDPLTGLRNRAAFHERGVEMVARHAGVAVLMLDLDGFKPVNDRLGHAAGDEVLAAVAGRLTGAVRSGDLVTRLGGDEFALVLADPADEDTARAVADRVLRAVAEPIRVRDGEVVSVDASIGLATGGGNLDELLRRADIAMYAAKAAGKGVLHVAGPTGLLASAGR